MMDGYDMNAWGWFGMVMVVIVTAAIVGLVSGWSRVSQEIRSTRRLANNSTRGSRVAKSTRRSTASGSRH